MNLLAGLTCACRGVVNRIPESGWAFLRVPGGYMSQDSYSDTCSVRLQKIEGSTVIDIEGEIDMASSPLIAKALDQAVHEEKSDVVLNARDLFYIDSSGIQILVSAGRRLADDGRRLFVVGCHGIFYKLVQVMRLDSEFCLYPDLREALSAINPDKASD